MREITLEASQNVKSWAKSISTEPNVIIRTINCKPYGPRGLFEFVEIISGDSIKRVLNKIRSEPDIIYSDFQIFDKFRASGIVITKNAPVCRLIASIKGVCKNCLLTVGANENKPVKWKVIFSGNISMNELLSELESKGLKANIREEGEVRRNGLLTFKQEKAIKLASDEGYFKFPRRVGLKKLSEILGMSPSTLDEVLRRAEGKIMKNHVGSPNGTAEET